VEDRLERMLGYLEHDRGNVNLAMDCAEAALAAGRPELANKILEPLEANGDLNDAAANLAGLAAMRSGDQPRAQRLFGALLTTAPDDEGLRFNMAWSLGLEGRHAEARDALGDIAGTSLPQAAMLDLQIHHHLGELDAAEPKLAAYIARFPDYAPLQSAASVLAMDADLPELARACALRGGDDTDALATLGALELGDNQLGVARDLFARALAKRESNPRANIGFGLVALAEGDSAQSRDYLDRGAAQFGNHLGSWIAAGWAHFLAGDDQTARARFETALAIDDNFGEAQGSMAAMDAFAGDFANARRRLTIAQRLDRQSFSAALTAMVLAAADGNQAQAKRIFETALKQPITHDGRSLGEALARVAI
jgi:Tfp pilus assembly protein PilF